MLWAQSIKKKKSFSQQTDINVLVTLVYDVCLSPCSTARFDRTNKNCCLIGQDTPPTHTHTHTHTLTHTTTTTTDILPTNFSLYENLFYRPSPFNIINLLITKKEFYKTIICCIRISYLCLQWSSPHLDITRKSRSLKKSLLSSKLQDHYHFIEITIIFRGFEP